MLISKEDNTAKVPLKRQGLPLLAWIKSNLSMDK